MNTSFLQGNSSAFYTMDGKVCLTSSLETNETAYCKSFHRDNFSLIIKAKELGGGGGGKLKTRVYWVKNANWFSRLYYRKFTPSYITSRDGILLTAMSILSLFYSLRASSYFTVRQILWKHIFTSFSSSLILSMEHLPLYRLFVECNQKGNQVAISRVLDVLS